MEKMEAFAPLVLEIKVYSLSLEFLYKTSLNGELEVDCC